MLDHVGPRRGHAEPKVAYVGPMLDPHGAMLGTSWPILGLCWAQVGLSWGPVGHVEPKNLVSKKRLFRLGESDIFQVTVACLRAMLPPCPGYGGLAWDRIGLCWPMLANGWGMSALLGAVSGSKGP